LARRRAQRTIPCRTSGVRQATGSAICVECLVLARGGTSDESLLPGFHVAGASCGRKLDLAAPDASENSACRSNSSDRASGSVVCAEHGSLWKREWHSGTVRRHRHSASARGGAANGLAGYHRVSRAKFDMGWKQLLHELFAKHDESHTGASVRRGDGVGPSPQGDSTARARDVRRYCAVFDRGGVRFLRQLRRQEWRCPGSESLVRTGTAGPSNGAGLSRDVTVWRIRTDRK